MVLSRREPLNMQGGDGDVVLDIACEQRDAMLQSGGGGQGIAHLHAVTPCLTSIKSVALRLMVAVIGKTHARRRSSIFCTASISALLRMP